MSFIINPYAHDAQALIGPNTGSVLATHHLKTMMQEGPVPVTDVAADGDPVSLIYDQTINSLIARQETDANRPVLGSDGTRNSFLTFDGTNDNLIVLSSISFFNVFWQAVPKGTILIWFKMNGGDGTSQFLMSNTDLITDAGLQIFRSNVGNTIIVRGGDGDAVSGGTDLSWTYTSTETVTVASGWRGLIVSINGTGASAGRFILMNSSGTILEDATFAVLAGTTVNAQSDLYIGARADAGGSPDVFLNGSISTIIVENFPVSDSLIEQFRNYNPARITTEFTPILQSLNDMNNTAFMFSNTAGTTPAVNNDPVRVIRNTVVGNFNITVSGSALRRQLFNTVSSATSPVLKTNVLNGKSALLFDGVDDNLNFLVPFFEEKGGKWTAFFVVQNLDATFGSHFLRGSNPTHGNYFVVTGSSYVGGLSSPYAVIHPNPAGTQIGVELKNLGVDDAKVMAFRRNGSALAGWNGDKVKATDTSSSPFSIQNMGIGFATLGTDWNADGYVFYMSKYNGVMTDTQVEAEIDRLNFEYGL